MGALVKMKAEALPGLAAADAAADAVFRKLLDMRARLEQAGKDVKTGVAKRDALLIRAKAGEVIRGEDVADVEAAIRTAESTAALMKEALPAVEKELAEAERALAIIAWGPIEQQKVAAQARYDAAVAAHAAAATERHAAFEHNQLMQLWDFNVVANSQLEQHAPAALDRAKALGKTRGF
jgi:hypothetical protein